MKYCSECKVFVNENLKNCPLCGSWTEECESNRFEDYAEQEKYVNYPSLKLKGDAYKSFLRKKSLFLTLTVILVCVLINVLLTPSSLWSAYVACGGMTVFLCVLSTIYKKRRFYSLLLVLAIVLPLTLVCLDIIQSFDRTGSFSAFGFSLLYAVPGFLMAMMITLDVLAAVEKSKYKYYLFSLLIVSLYALIPQIAVWIIPEKFPFWLTFSCFVFAVANGLTMTIIYWKSLKAEFNKKMHL